ncbi:MAG: Fic family protein [Sphingobacteriales bacterium]|nr:Fic family protein [Sphingobacteriales bacterium]MBI3718130.1 Fic family protein [Sphingobacteriales bacterium]
MVKMLPLLPIEKELETKEVLKKLTLAHKALAELKGLVTSIPNENILIETLTLREAKESSAIENIISTMEEVYQSSLFDNQFSNANTKEVHQYAAALKKGYALVKEKGLLTNNTILQIQQTLEENNAGFRKLPGTKLLNDKTGETIYTPPQDYETIITLMQNLERYINDDILEDTDPIIKMAVIHHQFESIHPFYDGNGRTGRIINILYLVHKKLLNLPILYLSSYIIRNKPAYYKLLQQVRQTQEWEEWILYMLTGVEETAIESIALISGIKKLMQEYKISIRNNLPKLYSQDLINNLFKYPYTKIEFIERDLQVSRKTAIRYLEQLQKLGVVKKTKIGRTNFYLNEQLYKLLSANIG